MTWKDWLGVFMVSTALLGIAALICFLTGFWHGLGIALAATLTAFIVIGAVLAAPGSKDQ